MSKNIKWGILSTANIAVEQVIPAIQRSANGEVHAIASSSGKAAAVAAKFNIPSVYESYEQLLADPSIDAVYIPLPNHLHYEWTLKAARAKKHVLCEKPAALNPEKVAEMISVCKTNGVHFMEGFMYRFHPQHEKVKELIANHEIGEIKMMRAVFSFYMENRGGNIRLNPDLGGGALYDIGCYCVNSICYLLGKEPLTTKIIGEVNHDGVDTSSVAVMTFPNHVYTSFMCSFDATLKNEYEIIGTKGTIRVPHAYRPDLNSGNGVVQLFQEHGSKEFVIYGDQYLLEVEHFADCILKDRQPVYTGEQMLVNSQVIHSLLGELSKQTAN
ncbi:Gfo/Idh/MocA family protein [Neobacillus vireti]|uniref:Oxidoreductase domain-containing protein n=1 Tax=Neobacillus vireti LMG 21834 TaxID=1131730 RepID=A0AB94IJX9_9BACI|nr:Gfo/Idh/MocA family oxidoreductase [Neobacillus vireti]ETI67303.1 oxidoreductase domain-containing protein [Neobacillus vireti LMG 21834]KLT18030.1 oxidoreductase [Neobacillus vireti]